MNNFLCFIEPKNSNVNQNLFLCKEISDDELLSFSTKLILDNLIETISDDYISTIKSQKSTLVDRLISTIIFYKNTKIKYNLYLFQSNYSKYEFMEDLIEYIKDNSIESHENYKSEFYINRSEN